MQAVIAGQIADFARFPPRQKPASFNLDAVLQAVTTGNAALAAAHH
jgi:arylsulfatase